MLVLLGPGWRREVGAKLFCAARRTDLDGKVFAVCETELKGRHLPFRDAVSELLETEWTRFPISSSRMARWVCKLVRDQDIAPRSRHVRCKASDLAVMDHEFCAQVFQSALVLRSTQRERVGMYGAVGVPTSGAHPQRRKQ